MMRSLSNYQGTTVIGSPAISLKTESESKYLSTFEKQQSNLRPGRIKRYVLKIFKTLILRYFVLH